MPSTLLSALSLLTLAGLAGAPEAPSDQAPPSQEADTVVGPSLTSAELQAFVERQAPQVLGEHDAEGATIAVVHDGELVVSAGFGHALLGDSVPVDPDSTRFRIGSVAKVITYAATMQRVDRGAIDPHRDVTAYLTSVSVEDMWDEPVTLAHLATHTAGFDVGAPGITPDRERLRPLRETLGSPRPARLRPPGRLPSYGNYATALAAQVLADESGRSFEAYVEENVFTPLGMDHSTFEPAPGGFGADAATFAQEVSVYSQVPPAGGMSSTASDMGRFMRALLTDGATEEGRILSPEATASMLEPWHTPHEAMAGAGFGFWREERGGTALAYHGGGIGTFQSQLILAPELDLGLFVAFHDGARGLAGTGGAFRAGRAFTEAFLDRFVPAERRSEEEGLSADPAHAGTYFDVGLHETKEFHKLLGLGDSPPLHVEVGPDGTLLTEGGEHRWKRVDEEVYRRTDGKDVMAIIEEEGGHTHLFRDTRSMRSYRQVGPHERPQTHGILLGISLLLLSTGVVGWPLGAWRRRRGGASDPPASLRRARWTVALAVGCLALFLAGLTLLVVTGALFHTPWWISVVLTMPTLAAAATVGAAYQAARGWREEGWPLATRLHHSAMVASLVVLLGLLQYWNLLHPFS